jgi:hypothetical protein
MMIKHMALIATLGILGLAGTPHSAAAAPIVLNLDCVLKFDPCQPSAIYGTITLTQVGAGVSVTVDLPGTRGKFRNLMLSYAGPATTITDNDSHNTVSLTPDEFRLSPYDGLFDIGGRGGKGWRGDDSYSTLLTGDIPLLLTDFVPADSGMYAVVRLKHIGSRAGGYCGAAQSRVQTIMVDLRGTTLGMRPRVLWSWLGEGWGQCRRAAAPTHDGAGACELDPSWNRIVQRRGRVNGGRPRVDREEPKHARGDQCRGPR